MVGIANLLDIVKVLQGKSKNQLSEEYGKGIVHIKDLIRYKEVCIIVDDGIAV